MSFLNKYASFLNLVGAWVLAYGVLSSTTNKFLDVANMTNLRNYVRV